jgi:hypothetical protein
MMPLALGRSQGDTLEDLPNLVAELGKADKTANALTA